MDNIELFYPEIQVVIGTYTFSKGVSLTISSSGDISDDWGMLAFTKEFYEKIIIPENAPVSVYLGYDGAMQEVFKGFVVKGYNSASDENEILFKDRMLLLERTVITNTFLKTTPQEIIQYGLNTAGIADYKLSDTVFPNKSRLPIFRKNMVSVLKQINNVWGIDVKGCFIKGIFYWGEMPEQEIVYGLEYGVNIISLERINGLWQLETVSLPSLQHSQQINVVHPYVNGTFVIQKLVFTTNDAGFVRTKIYF